MRLCRARGGRLTYIFLIFLGEQSYQSISKSGPSHFLTQSLQCAQSGSRGSPIRDTLYRRFQPFRHLHDSSGCFRLERSPVETTPRKRTSARQPTEQSDLHTGSNHGVQSLSGMTIVESFRLPHSDHEPR